MGSITRQLLSPPPRCTGLVNTPRLSLRKFANLYLLGYGLILYLTLSLLFGRLTTVGVAILFFSIYILLGAFRDWWNLEKPKTK